MRYHEIKGGIKVPLSIEEHTLVESVGKRGIVSESDFEHERDAELARTLCSRGIFELIENEDDTIAYKVNKLEDIWRD